MPYSFILETVIFAGIGAIILILARALPRIEDETTAGRSRKGKIAKITQKIPFDKIDDSLSLVFYKALRKIKIIIMKADNFITEKLKKARSDSSSNKKQGTGIPL